MRRFQALALFLVLTNAIIVIAFNAECIIYSDYYNNQYLYAPSDFINWGSKLLFDQDRTALVWRGALLNRIFSGKKNKFFDSERSALWELIPAANVTNGYYLRNLKYDEYLYASNYKYDALFGAKRRRVFTRKMVSENDGSSLNRNQFLWRLETRETPELFHICNQHFNEPLYVASVHYKNDEYRRNVFTWHTLPDSKQFLFAISCHDGMLSLGKS